MALIVVNLDSNIKDAKELRLASDKSANKCSEKIWPKLGAKFYLNSSAGPFTFQIIHSLKKFLLQTSEHFLKFVVDEGCAPNELPMKSYEGKVFILIILIFCTVASQSFPRSALARLLLGRNKGKGSARAAWGGEGGGKGGRDAGHAPLPPHMRRPRPSGAGPAGSALGARRCVMTPRRALGGSPGNMAAAAVEPRRA